MSDNFLTAAIWWLASINGIWLVLLLLLSRENHRFSVRRLRRTMTGRTAPQPTCLIVPVKGPDKYLAANLQAFFSQDHPDYDLLFPVEAADDPAVEVVLKLQEEFPLVRCRIVIAGRTETQGQKVHNLLAATREIPRRTRVLAFADADIRPNTNWLRTLCEPVLRSSRYSANTGYRWILPTRLNTGSLLVHCINSATAGLLGVGRHHPVWGGSWAIRRKEFERLKIREAWRGTLSDDLVASRVLSKDGLGVAFDPRCFSRTEVDLDLSSALEFLRRQFVIAKFYSPNLYRGALCALSLSVASWWGLVWIAMTGNSLNATIALCGLGVFYAGYLIRGAFRQHIFSVCGPEEFRKHRLAAAIDVLAGPLTTTATTAIMLWSTVGKRIVWRGNEYVIDRSGQARLIKSAAAGDYPRAVIPFPSGLATGSQKRLSQPATGRTADPSRKRRAA